MHKYKNDYLEPVQPYEQKQITIYLSWAWLCVWQMPPL
jgi:hypothetical protein